MYDDIQPEVAHRKFAQIILQFRNKLQSLKPTVGYYISDGIDYSYAGVFEGWKEIEKGYANSAQSMLRQEKHPIDDGWGFRNRTSSRAD